MSIANWSILMTSVTQGRLHQLQSISCASSEVLCLSLDWSNRRTPSKYVHHHARIRRLSADTVMHSGLGNLIVSLSDGSLSLLQPEDSTGLAVTDSWHAHDYEPWIAAWDYWNTNVVYSGQWGMSAHDSSHNQLIHLIGGDDLKMKGWDVRQGGSAPLFVNKR